MTVLINAPTIRPLTENEKRVYALLKAGKTPQDIARQLHMLYRADSCIYNTHDTPMLSVSTIISSIREKGWTIPQGCGENEEDKTMAKITAAEKPEIIKKVYGGAMIREVAAEYGVDKSTIYNIVQDYKLHGAPTDTGAETEMPEKAQAETPAEQPTEKAEEKPTEQPPALAEEFDVSSDYMDMTVTDAIVMMAVDHIRTIAQSRARLEKLRLKIKNGETEIKCLEKSVNALKTYLSAADKFDKLKELAECEKLWEDTADTEADSYDD